MSKLTKNYIQLSEGLISESEFLRQTRLQFPGVISQFNSFKDAISILTSKGLLSEEVIYQCKGDKFPLESIERGIRWELEEQGFMDTPDSGEYWTIKKKVIDNLCKDPLWYLKKTAVCCDKAKKSQAEAENKKGKNYKEKKTEGGMKPVKSKKTETLKESKSVAPVVDDKSSIVLKESISKLITKILSEAATTNLAQLSDQNASVQGVPAILNTFENIVTEIESFIVKTKTKIQGAFDSIGAIKNEDNIPVGYKFVQPILESFKKDLEPVLQKISLDDLNLPSAPETNDTGMETDEPILEPKQTVYSPKQPLAENKRPRRKYTL